MKTLKKKWIVFVCAITAALFVLACSDDGGLGTVNWPTEIPYAVQFSVQAFQEEDGTTGINLVWQQDKDARGYEIFRRNEAGNTDTITIRSGTTTALRDLNIEPGKAYGYKIRAYNGAGPGMETEQWVIVIAYPERVLNLQVEAITHERIDAAWNRVERANLYYIYRSETDDFESAVIVDSTLTGEVYTHVDTNGLEPHTLYYYWVRAVVFDGDTNKVGPPSNVASARTKLSPPDTVIVEIINGGNDVRISWTDVEGAIGYEIYYESGVTHAPFTYIIAVGRTDRGPIYDIFTEEEVDGTVWWTFVDDGFVEIGTGALLRYGVRAVERFADNGDVITGNYKDNLTGAMAIGEAVKK